MVEHYSEDMNNIRLKVLEYVIWGEKIALDAGAINYGFSYRKDYLDVVMSFGGYEELRKWFLEKMINLCRGIRDYKEEQSNSAVKKAMNFIQDNYSREVSLDDVSGEVLIISVKYSKKKQEKILSNILQGYEWRRQKNF